MACVCQCWHKHLPGQGALQSDCSFFGLLDMQRAPVDLRAQTIHALCADFMPNGHLPKGRLPMALLLIFEKKLTRKILSTYSQSELDTMCERQSEGNAVTMDSLISICSVCAAGIGARVVHDLAVHEEVVQLHDLPLADPPFDPPCDPFDLPEDGQPLSDEDFPPFQGEEDQLYQDTIVVASPSTPEQPAAAASPSTPEQRATVPADSDPQLPAYPDTITAPFGYDTPSPSFGVVDVSVAAAGPEPTQILSSDSQLCETPVPLLISCLYCIR